MTLIRYALAVFLVAATLPALADTVDDFTVPMGPITVGPGEEPTEEEATMFAAGVLGGFRVLVPVVDEEAPASDRATTSIVGGVFECDLTATSFGGGCTVGWPGDEEGDSFDFTEAGAVEFEILEAAAGAIVAVILINGSVSLSDVISGEETNGAVAFLENPGPGVYSLPIEQFFNFSNPTAPFDFTTVTVVAMSVAFEESFNGLVRIGPVTTSGPIGNGPDVGPPDDPPADDDLRPLLSGTYYNAARDGEGFQVTVLGETGIEVITWYTYLDGRQAWLIGTGIREGDRIAFDDLVITEGADFGPDFDPGDVVRIPWGSITLDYSDCNTAMATVSPKPELTSFDAFEVEVQKLVPGECLAD
ncbi:hypothetical protein F3N42_09710 [Marinihelvus fidelis]|uniref:Uncharacterized protein n=1 Tax=Marinihelvus fidelis TaxID=2613842 RepID=A0A5N0T9Y4_9GAMM|nr:hypothetical protein [Marinihelvus fidelis]KAA9131581.1 hypothetical protein F3N42_09710 [Marinihelvus fidelis]